MDRRSFLGLVSSLGAKLNTGILLEAIAAPHMPHTLVVRGITGLEGGVFELRKYQSTNSRDLHARIFSRCGIQPILTLDDSTLTYLIPFKDLTAREQAWRLFNADPEWPSAAGPIEISLYRQPASFDMSL